MPPLNKDAYIGKKNDWNGPWGEGLMLWGSFLSFPPLTSFLFLQDNIFFQNNLNIHYSWAWELESEGQKERQGRRVFKSQGASESPRDLAEIQVPQACPRDPDLACLWRSLRLHFQPGPRWCSYWPPMDHLVALLLGMGKWHWIALLLGIGQWQSEVKGTKVGCYENTSAFFSLCQFLCLCDFVKAP